MKRSNLIPITKIYDIYPKYTYSEDVKKFMDEIVDIDRVNVYRKDELIAMLKELRYDLYHALCHEIHGKEEEDCPCTNQISSCLATFRVCDANEAIYKAIQEKINELEGK